MGSSSSTRAKAQAKAGVATGSDASNAAVCDVTSGTALTINAVTNAGGDVGGSRHSSPPAVDPSTSSASGATKMFITSDGEQCLDENSASAVIEEKLDEGLEDSSTEDSSSTRDVDVKSKTTVTEDAGVLGKDALEKRSSEGGQELLIAKIAAVPGSRDVACQSDCTGDEPDDPITTDVDAPPPSPQHVLHVASADRDPELTDNQIPPSCRSEGVLCHFDGAFPAGPEGTPLLIDPKALVIPEYHQQLVQPCDPPSVEGLLSYGMEGNGKAAFVADPQQKSFPVGDVTACKGPCPTVMSVRHDENAHGSSGLPPVD